MREALAVPLFATLLMVGVPTVALMIGGGAESEANMWKFVFYGVMGALPAFLVSIVRLLESEDFFERNEQLKPFSRFTVHSPRNTYLGTRFGTISEAISKPQNLFLISFIPALFMGMLIGITGTFVSGIPVLTQGQITSGAQLGLAVEPAVFSETMFFNMFMFFLLTGSIAWFLWQKLELSLFWSYVIAKTIVVPLNTLIFVAYHFFRYAGSEASLLGVFFLGLLTNLLTAATDSIIPAYLVHANGNFFHKLRAMGIFTNEMMIVFTVAIAVVSLLAYTWLFNPFGLLDGE